MPTEDVRVLTPQKMQEKKPIVYTGSSQSVYVADIHCRKGVEGRVNSVKINYSHPLKR